MFSKDLIYIYINVMWSIYLYGRQSRKKYLYKSFEELSKTQCICTSQNIFLEFKTMTPWAENLDLFISNDNNVGCIRNFNHLWRWEVAAKVEAQYKLIE